MLENFLYSSSINMSESTRAAVHSFWKDVDRRFSFLEIEGLPAFQIRRIVFSVAGFTVLNLVSRVLMPRIFPEYTKILERKKKFSYFIQIFVGFVHACLVSYLAVDAAFIHPHSCPASNDIWGKSDRTQLLFAILSGYFVQDFGTMFYRETFDIPFAIHHVLFTICFVAVQQSGLLSYYSIRMILFELTTIFFQLARMSYYLDYVGAQAFFNQCFGVLFLIIRNIYGIYISVDAYRMLLNYPADLPNKYLIGLIAFANVTVHIMNAHWLRLILKKSGLFKKEKLDKTNNKLKST